MALAIFDLDNTLLHGDSDHAWGEFLVQKGIVEEASFKEANDHFYEQYKQGKLDIFEYLHFALEPLTQHSLEQLHAWHQEFMSEIIEPMILPKAEELLAKHKALNDYILIITATNLFVTEPIAKRLGVDAILASDPEFIDGKYTGKVAGTPCFQDGKVTRLKAWLKDNDHSLSGSYFYSDSHNDLPLLEMVEKPVVVDADETLLQHAQDNEWPIITLRD